MHASIKFQLAPEITPPPIIMHSYNYIQQLVDVAFCFPSEEKLLSHSFIYTMEHAEVNIVIVIRVTLLCST